MLTSQSFRCTRCADCCRHLTVKLRKKDIKEIRRAGYSEEFFLDYDTHIKSPVLRMQDNTCVFLDKKKGSFHCKIYENRPKVCRQYPFVNSKEIESCRPNLLKYRFK